MKTSGLIYVASRRLNFVCEAIASAESAKARNPGIAVTLMTDIDAVASRPIAPFDRIFRIDATLPGSDAGEFESWVRGLYAKLVALRESPYERTVYVDTDTRILSSELPRLFEELDEHSMAMVPCTPTMSRDCFLYGPMYSAGVIAYKREEAVSKLFQKWDALHRFQLQLAKQDPPGDVPYLSHLQGDEKRRMLVSDQTSLAELLSPCHNECGVSVKTLNEIWNARGRSRSDLDRVVIDHADCHKIALHDVRPFLTSRDLGYLFEVEATASRASA